jgi:hypothetical protein
MAETKKATYPWIVAAVLVGVGLALFNWLTDQGTQNIAYRFGVAFGQALLGWLALLLTGLQRAGLRGVVGAFLVVWLVALTGMVPANVPSRFKTGEPALSEQMKEVRAAVRDGRQVSLTPQEPRTGGMSERELVIEFNKRVLKAILDYRNAYLAELRAIGWESVFDVNRLVQDKGMARTEQMLVEAKDASRRSCDGYRSNAESNARRIVTELGASDRQQKEMLKGFLGGLDRGAPAAEASCRLELAMMKEFEGAVLVLKDESSWIVEDGQMMFTNADSMERFNLHLGNIHRMNDEQTRLMDDSMRRGQEELERLGM